MVGRKTYVFDISPHRGVTTDAMASMLSSWVLATADLSDWIGHDVARDMMGEHNLRPKDIESMTINVLDAMHDSGLYEHLRFNKAKLNGVVCMVNKGNSAYVQLEWV